MGGTKFIVISSLGACIGNYLRKLIDPPSFFKVKKKHLWPFLVMSYWHPLHSKVNSWLHSFRTRKLWLRVGSFQAQV